MKILPFATVATLALSLGPLSGAQLLDESMIPTPDEQESREDPLAVTMTVIGATTQLIQRSAEENQLRGSSSGRGFENFVSNLFSLFGIGSNRDSESEGSASNQAVDLMDGIINSIATTASRVRNPVTNETYREELLSQAADRLERLGATPEWIEELISELREEIPKSSSEAIELLVDIIEGTDEEVEYIADPHKAPREAEEALDWTGFVEYSEFCPSGRCPGNSVCRDAPYTSESGQRCRCSEGHELTTDSHDVAMCTNFYNTALWLPADELCPNGQRLCSRAYCRTSEDGAEFCGCEPGRSFKFVLGRWRCRS